MVVLKMIRLFCIIFPLIVSCTVVDKRSFADLDPALKGVITSCKVCHSTIEMQRGPLLEGLDVKYLEANVIKFKKGIRGTHSEDKTGQLMQAAVKDMPEKDLIAAVRWFAGQERPKMKSYIKGDLVLGKKIYEENCYRCHEHTMGKFFSKSPSLYELEDWYQMVQLRSFKNQWRGSHPEDDRGKKMMDATQELSVNDIKAVTAYLASFEGRK